MNRQKYGKDPTLWDAQNLPDLAHFPLQRLAIHLAKPRSNVHLRKEKYTFFISLETACGLTITVVGMLRAHRLNAVHSSGQVASRSRAISIVANRDLANRGILLRPLTLFQNGFLTTVLRQRNREMHGK